MSPRPLVELEAGLAAIEAAPRDHGTLAWIVRRPREDEREVLQEGELSLAEGLRGDNWRLRPSKHSPDGGPHPDRQLNVMSARAIALIAGDPAAWAAAGDQLYLDLDVSETNLPVGARLAIGAAIVEVTAPPHSGCAKFQARFGADALRFVNSPAGRALRLRGFNAKVVQPGVVRRGDPVRKV